MNEAVHELIEGNKREAEKHRIAYGKEVYDNAIDHCIATVEGFFKDFPMPIVDFDTFLIERLNNLKNNK